MTTTDKITPYRTDLTLWLLTGRSSGFANAALNHGVNYQVSETPAVVTGARSLLRLDDERSDFYVLGALGAASTLPELLRLVPGDNPTAFLPGVILPRAHICSCPLLPVTSLSWPSISGVPAGTRGFTVVEFTKSGGEVIVTADNGERTASGFSLAVDGDRLKVTVDKAEEFGILAAFHVPAWEDGDSIGVEFRQEGYPYGAMAEAIKNSEHAARLMGEDGTMAAFAATTNPCERVGLLAVSIIRCMAGKLTPLQFGFTLPERRSTDWLSPDRTAGTTLEASLEPLVVNPMLPGGFNV